MPQPIAWPPARRPAPVEERAAARVRLRGLAGFVGTGVVLSALGRVGVGLPCPWLTLTGTLCPLCGSTTLGIELTRLDPVAAHAANPFMFWLLALLGVLGVAWTVTALGGPGVRLPRWVGRAPERWWLLLGALALGWAVWRNLA